MLSTAGLQVKDWGSGQPEDLGGLQVQQDATRVFEAAGASSTGSDDAASTSGSQGQGMPFHETLARRLELLQSQGALGNLAQASAQLLPLLPLLLLLLLLLSHMHRLKWPMVAAMRDATAPALASRLAPKA